MRLSKLTIQRRTLESIIKHARTCYPAEAVGLLAGSPAGEIHAVYQLSNIGPLGTFLADPFEQWKALRDLKRAGRRLLAIYHSHPEGGATLSESDTVFARDIDALSVVFTISSDDTAPIQFRAFRVEFAGSKPVAVDIVD